MVRLVLRIDFDDERYIGHGRIELLELIGKHGSILKAAKAMNMSYKRAWYLVDDFSACFSEPLVARQHGGKGGGSAALTDFGCEVVARYRRMELHATKAIKDDIAALRRHVPTTRGKGGVER